MRNEGTPQFAVQSETLVAQKSYTRSSKRTDEWGSLLAPSRQHSPRMHHVTRTEKHAGAVLCDMTFY